jgi:tetratricopeptide (TPR) repeat protein
LEKCEHPLTLPSPQRGEGITTAKTVSGLWFRDYFFPYVISLFCFFLALLSKEMAATLPLILVVYDLLFPSPTSRHGGFRRSARVYAGYALVVLAYLALRYVAFYNPSEGAVGYMSGRLPVRLAAVPQIFSLYLRLFILPLGLSVEYDESLIRPFVSFDSFAAIVVTALFIALIVRLWKRRLLACFALSFVLVGLLPVLDIVPISNMIAERYLYLPCFGMAMLGALLFGALAHAGGKRLAVLISVPVFVLYGSATIERNAVWRNSLTLWSDGVRKAPKSSRARLNLGVALGDKGDVTGAIAQYEESIRLSPASPDAYNNLGLIYFARGKIDRAIEYYRKSIRVDPMQVKGYMNLALALIQKGEKEEGTRIVERLVAIKPLNAPLNCNLGNIYMEDGRYEKAAEQFDAALKIKPYHFEALQGLGKLYFQKGKWDEAAAYFDRACSSHGASYARSISMGNIYYAQGRLDKAEAEFKRAAELKPRLADGYNNLGLVYQRRKDYESAARNLRKALGYEPGNPTILLNLARVLYSDNQAPEARDCIAKIFRLEKVPEQVSLDLARFYYRNKLYGEAIDTYRKTLDKRPEYGWGYFHAARAYALLGEPEQAASWLNKGARYLTDEHIRAIADDPAFAAIGMGAETANDK